MCCRDNKCGCGGHGHQKSSCGCHNDLQFDRWLWTKQEKIDWLEGRLGALQGEVTAYQDRIAALKGEE